MSKCDEPCRDNDGCACAAATAAMIPMTQAEYDALHDALAAAYPSPTRGRSMGRLTADLARARQSRARLVRLVRAVTGEHDYRMWRRVARNERDARHAARRQVEALEERVAALMTERDKLRDVVRDIDWAGTALIAREYASGSRFVRDLVEKAHAALVADATVPRCVDTLGKD